MLSAFPCTGESIPQILASIAYHGEIGFEEYSRNAYNQSYGIKQLSEIETLTFSALPDDKQSTELFTDWEAVCPRATLWEAADSHDYEAEYTTTGKAWELNKITQTGKAYDSI